MTFTKTIIIYNFKQKVNLTEQHLKIFIEAILKESIIIVFN